MRCDSLLEEWRRAHYCESDHLFQKTIGKKKDFNPLYCEKCHRITRIPKQKNEAWRDLRKVIYDN